MKNALIVAGETSGDIHASNLIKNLKALSPNLHFYGIGGKRMEEAGVELVERMEHLSIIGILEVLFKLRHIHLAYKKIMEKARKTPPDIVILIDYPGFNLTLAKALDKMGHRIIYYITPQVWAWGKSRIKTIKKCIDKALVIFKFEEDLFKKHGVEAVFVGHPLLDRKLPSEKPDKKAAGLDPEKTTVALLPGSRESEVSNTLRLMLKSADLMLKEKPLQFILLKSSGVKDTTYDEILKNTKLPIASLKDDSYGCLSLSDFVFTSSGTATLESAIMERPMLITYRTSFLTSILFKFFADTRFIGLVNIIAKREIVPEVLQYDANPKNLSSAILSILSSDEKQKRQITALREVKATLGTPGASLRAAHIINAYLT